MVRSREHSKSFTISVVTIVYYLKALDESFPGYFGRSLTMIDTILAADTLATLVSPRAPVHAWCLGAAQTRFHGTSRSGL